MTDAASDLDQTARRGASVRLDVEGDIGSEARLREAMDPANQSLNEALRLSFRVLQLAIVVLLALFLFSGFRTVGNTQSGVATVWGRIVDPAGLEPGLASNWPPPIGGFVLFQADGRSVTDDNAFVSQALLAHGQDRSVNRAVSSDRLKPDRDGSFLSIGGEIGHIRVKAHYAVSSPARFLEHIGEADADALVRKSLQRAVVQVAATRTLASIRDDLTNDGLRSIIRNHTQEMLDAATSGLRVTSVDLQQEPLPPAAVQKDFEAYSRVRQQVSADIEQARQDAQEILLTAAGPAHEQLSALIQKYELAFASDDTKGAAQIMASIDSVLDSEAVTGQVARTIDSARRHRVQIEQTLGREARLFAGLQESYRRNPSAVISRRWLESVGEVFERKDIEIIQLPSGIGKLAIGITGSQAVRDLRRSLRLDQVDYETWAHGYTGSDLEQFQGIEELKMDKGGRQLAIDEKGRIKGMRQDK